MQHYAQMKTLKEIVSDTPFAFTHVDISGYVYSPLLWP